MKISGKQAAAAGKEITKALKGLSGVSFTLDVVIYHWPGDKGLIRTQVHLWFGQHFEKVVQGGDDITWLAKECRRVALECFEKIKDISAKQLQKED